MGLCLRSPLGRGLKSVATRAQRLKIVELVSALGKRNNVIYKHGCGHPSALGTVTAQRLVGQHEVANALPTFVIAALVGW